MESPTTRDCLPPSWRHGMALLPPRLRCLAPCTLIDAMEGGMEGRPHQCRIGSTVERCEAGTVPPWLMRWMQGLIFVQLTEYDQTLCIK
jgi:hypothetical protein